MKQIFGFISPQWLRYSFFNHKIKSQTSTANSLESNESMSTSRKHLKHKMRAWKFWTLLCFRYRSRCYLYCLFQFDWWKSTCWPLTQRIIRMASEILWPWEIKWMVHCFATCPVNRDVSEASRQYSPQGFSMTCRALRYSLLVACLIANN